MMIITVITMMMMMIKIIKNLSIKFQKSPEFCQVFTIPVRHIGNITYVIFINITWEAEISTKIARFHDP